MNKQSFLSGMLVILLVCSIALASEGKQVVPKDISKALFSAIMGDDSPEAAKRFLDQGVDVNATFDSESGPSLLLIAADSGNPNIVKFLLARGADVNAIQHFHDSTTDETTVLSAVTKGTRNGMRTAPLILQILLEHGANPNYVFKRSGKTILQRHEETVQRFPNSNGAFIAEKFIPILKGAK